MPGGDYGFVTDHEGRVLGEGRTVGIGVSVYGPVVWGLSDAGDKERVYRLDFVYCLCRGDNSSFYVLFDTLTIAIYRGEKEVLHIGVDSGEKLFLG